MWKEGPIIIVDDDPDDQFLSQRTLQKFELTNDIIVFNNGKDALEFLQQPSVNPFLILCDIDMPVMNGVQMREMMCKNEKLLNQNTPFIFLSASVQKDDSRKTSQFFTHGCFQKDTSLEKYELTLRRIVEYWQNCCYK